MKESRHQKKAKAVALAGETAFGGELAGSTGVETNAGSVAHPVDSVNGTSDIQSVPEAIQTQPGEAKKRPQEQSTDEWLESFEKAPESAAIIELAKRKAFNATQRQRRYEKTGAANERPGFDVRATGALTEVVFDVGDDSYIVRTLDKHHPELAKDGYAALKRIDLSLWHGVFRAFDVFKEGGRKERKEMQISAVPFEVSRVIRDENGQFAVELRYLPAVGTEYKTSIWRLSDLVNTDKRGEAWQTLADEGLLITNVQHAAALVKRAYSLAGLEGSGVALDAGTTRSGFTGSEFSSNGFMTPHAPALMTRTPGSEWKTAGDKDAYLNAMRDMLGLNPVVALICGYFVAGSFIKKVGGSNFIVELVGRSSSGKTLVIRTALSMRGDPTAFDTFGATSNALKTLTLANNDQSMVLDEIGTWAATPEQKVSFIYDIEQGKPRRRLTKQMQVNAADDKAHYTVILSGEKSLLADIKSPPDGVKVRLTTLNFDPAQGRHLWDSIRDPKAAEDWEYFLHDNHGWIMPLVIEKIRELGDVAIRQRYRDCLSQLRAGLLEAGDSPPETVLRKLHLWSAALTGTQLLAEVLGFDASTAGARALELIDGISREAADEGTKNEVFAAVLKNALNDTKHFLQPMADKFDKPPETVWGEVKNANGSHVVLIDRARMDHFCALHKVDRGLFLSWARDEGVLTRYVKEKDPISGQPKRFTDVAKLKIGNASLMAYSFDMAALDAMEARREAEAERRALEKERQLTGEYDPSEPVPEGDPDPYDDDSIPF